MVLNLTLDSLGSPFRVQVRDRLDPNRVNVKMSQTMRANVLQEILIDGQAAGPGSPTVEITDIHGRSSSLHERIARMATRDRSSLIQRTNERTKERHNKTKTADCQDRRHHHWHRIAFH